MHQLWPIDASSYDRHELHDVDRAWPESNCYVDLWVELLHASGMEPLAGLPFAFAVDLEGDQWTFFKFPLADLDRLYGIEVFEVNVWRQLLAHLDEQLALGRPCLVEVDAFHLPDTAGTSYLAEHVKTTIGIQGLDRSGRRLGYFHNAGYYQLADADFAGLFRLDGHAAGPDTLPPYVEAAKLGVRPPLNGRALVTASIELLNAHLTRLPRTNPFHRYAARFPVDLDRLTSGPMDQFHAYAFATLRQCGSAFELGGAYLRWLQANGEAGLEPLAACCDDIAVAAKTLQFKAARFVNTTRPFDPAPLLETMAQGWDETMTGLTERYGALAHHA